MNSPGSITVYELQDVWTVARLTLPTGSHLQQSDVIADGATSIVAHVYDVTDSVTLLNSYTVSEDSSLQKANCVFNDLQTDGYWPADPTGYNFRHKMIGSNFTEGGRRYTIEYHISTASYGKMVAITDVTTVALAAV